VPCGHFQYTEYSAIGADRPLGRDCGPALRRRLPRRCPPPARRPRGRGWGLRLRCCPRWRAWRCCERQRPRRGGGEACGRPRRQARGRGKHGRPRARGVAPAIRGPGLLAFPRGRFSPVGIALTPEFNGSLCCAYRDRFHAQISTVLGHRVPTVSRPVVAVPFPGIRLFPFLRPGVSWIFPKKWAPPAPTCGVYPSTLKLASFCHSMVCTRVAVFLSLLVSLACPFLLLFCDCRKADYCGEQSPATG
jgi:hypothetical protein